MALDKNEAQPSVDHTMTGDDPAFDKLRDTGRVTEVQGDAQFYETVTAAPLSAWSKTSLQLFAILLVAALNATASGFDGSIFSSINAMPQYQAYFHQKDIGSSTGMCVAPLAAADKGHH